MPKHVYRKHLVHAYVRTQYTHIILVPVRPLMRSSFSNHSHYVTSWSPTVLSLLTFRNISDSSQVGCRRAAGWPCGYSNHLVTERSGCLQWPQMSIKFNWGQKPLCTVRGSKCQLNTKCANDTLRDLAPAWTKLKLLLVSSLTPTVMK